MAGSKTKPLVLVTADVRSWEDYKLHAAVDLYLKAASDVADVCPVIVPSLGEDVAFESLLNHASGVLATGARSNVYPPLYGRPATEIEEPFDHLRDATAIPLIQKAIERDMPLFAICRGHQELNAALGGTIASEIQNLEGRADHRGPDGDLDARFAIRHTVNLTPGGLMEKFLQRSSIEVNSVHRQAIDDLAPELTIEAKADDGTIEAVSVTKSKTFSLGLQWHPEYWSRSDKPSKALFEAFGMAVHQYTAEKLRG